MPVSTAADPHPLLRRLREQTPVCRRGPASWYLTRYADVLRVLRILKKNNFTGVIIPDHAPQMSCAAPWHAGMAYALGYLKAGLKTLANE